MGSRGWFENALLMLSVARLSHMATHQSQKRHRVRARRAGLFCILLLSSMASWRIGGHVLSSTACFMHKNDGPFAGSARRAGGAGTLVGATACGAACGGMVVSRLPVVNFLPFTDLIGTLGGALAGFVCAQFPHSYNTLEGRLGEFCRGTGHAAAEFGGSFWNFVMGS